MLCKAGCGGTSGRTGPLYGGSTCSDEEAEAGEVVSRGSVSGSYVLVASGRVVSRAAHD